MPAHSSLRHPKKTLMKASSFDVLRQMSFDEESAVNCTSILPNQDNAARRPASSSNLAIQTTRYPTRYVERERSLAFQIGNTSGDDVFTDQPVSELGCRDAASKGTGDGAEETSTESSELAASQRDTNLALVPHEPFQTDAQNIYPSSACVFVANLGQAFDDGRLEVEVTKYFSQFGTVFVKIRRDNRQMPFAFCQFTCDADAESAGKYGNGAVILGRPCRVEKATAHSCFIVYKLSGAEISRQEAIELLGVLGTIAKAYPLDPRSQKTEKSPPAMVVHYKRYDSSRSVTFEGHPIFCVDAYDPKAETRQQHKRNDQQGYAQYEKDRRSAYFGNLPLNMTSDVLRSLASSCGKVLCAEIATKEVPQAGGKTATTCFAFVEFVRPDSVDNAIMNYHRKLINGHVIKVERKRTRTFNGPSHGANSSQRGSSASTLSTWHGGRIGNRGCNDNRTMNDDTFIPPVATLSATHLLPRAETQEDSLIPPSTSDGDYHLPRMSATQWVQRATGLAIGEKAPAALVQFPTAVSCGSISQPSVFSHGKDIGIGGAAESKNIKIELAMEKENLISNAKHKGIAEGPKAATTMAQVPKTSEQYTNDNCQGKANEHSCEFEDSRLTQNETTDDKKNVETPTKSPMQVDVRAPHENGADSATSCFYPIIPPYPYSPYGFSPMQPFMANPMTPQGGPAIYNSFGHTYYSPTPYSDMYTMYPMIQQYPTAPLETPTHPQVLSQGIEYRQEGSQEEPFGMSPKIGTKTDGKGKEEEN
ncbi:hypothetical protein ACHAQJ_002531 [Trichoderma viride]